jgi:hypothetical protein
MPNCGTSYSFQCGSNYQSGWNSVSSHCNSGTSSKAATACHNFVQSYQAHESCYSSSYSQSHHCGSSSSGTVNVVTVALQDAAKIGAGVQGDVGCTLDQCGQPHAPDLSSFHSLDNTDGLTVALTGINNGTTTVLGDGIADSVTIDSGDHNLLAVGNGAGDQVGIGDLADATAVSNNNVLVAGGGDNDFLYVGQGDGNQLFVGNGNSDILLVNGGDSNALIAGDGAQDLLILGNGNNNDLHAGNGAGDQVVAGTGDNNCLTVGNGDGDFVTIGFGNSNELTAGNGLGDAVSVETGDNNLMTVGGGAADLLSVGTGDHNTLAAANGAGDVLTLGTGNYNLLHAGDGAGDILTGGTGNFNALIAGNGAGDTVSGGIGDNDILATGNGAGDLITFARGDNNLILQGDGIGDQIQVGIGNNNAIVMGGGNGDVATGSLGDGNVYLTGAGNDLVHTGGGADVVYVDNHTEQSTAAMADPFHLTTQDSLAQNLFADGGNDLFIIDGLEQCGCQPKQVSSCHYGTTYSTAVTWQTALAQDYGDAPGLGTTVMTGGGGAEKYWFDNQWGNSVITDYVAGRDKIMIGGVYGSDISDLGSVKFQYIHSAYDTTHTGAVDLLITFGSAANISQSITLIDFKDTNASIASSFNNVTVSNDNASATLLSKIFDFSAADNQAVTNEIASLNAQHLILH